MSDELKGRVALVTGGTGGIGTAICERLSAMGARVATTYRNQAKAESWQEGMKKAGHDVAIYACDVGDYDACVSLVAQVEKELGPVDILVNNAGITRDITLKKMTPQAWREVICADLDSVFNMTQPLLTPMAERGWGRVINISSVNGQKGQFGQANYCSAKAGMHGFTMSAAQEVARKGVTVNTISPGYIATEMVMAVPEEVREKIIAQIPVGRLGRPEEVAHVVAFLASEQAGFITGANFAANGGQHMH
jgi:acetoacetyl-CoA reductase